MTKDLVSLITQFMDLISNFKSVLIGSSDTHPLIDFLNTNYDKINNALVYWYNLSQQKLKEKMKKENKYYMIKKQYEEIMLIQALPFI